MLLKDHSIDARATTSVAYKISKNMARTYLYARNGPILQITVKRLKITAFQLFVLYFSVSLNCNIRDTLNQHKSYTLLY